MNTKSEQIVIVGGGLFGLSAAIILAEAGYKITVIEKNLDTMQEASLVNQNRIHYGYHYPRSLSTGKEALEGLPTFKEYYGSCINSGFTKYYGIAKNGSYINAAEFASFCEQLNIPLEECWPDEHLLNRDLLENCWKVYEPAFDYYKLREAVNAKLNEHKNIRVLRNTYINYAEHKDSVYHLKLNNGYRMQANVVVNASYSGLSDVLKTLGMPVVKAHYELLILPIVRLPEHIKPFGVTIMDGPFCSIMPKGFSSGEYILSHVSHSVVQSHLGYEKPEWNAIDGNIEKDIIDFCKAYYPVLEHMTLKESWITTKMVLPNQDIDDARPTLVLKHNEQVYSLFSGKITTCISAAQNLLSQINKSFNNHENSLLD